mgnify:CR=1 FL=1
MYLANDTRKYLSNGKKYNDDIDPITIEIASYQSGEYGHYIAVKDYVEFLERLDVDKTFEEYNFYSMKIPISDDDGTEIYNILFMWNIIDKDAIIIGLYNTSDHTYVKIDYDNELHDNIANIFEQHNIRDIDDSDLYTKIVYYVDNANKEVYDSDKNKIIGKLDKIIEAQSGSISVNIPIIMFN